MRITLFSQWECKTCVALKDLMTQENIKYKVIEVLKNKELWEEIRKEELKTNSNIMYTPTILVEDKKNRIYIAAGRDFNTPDEALLELKQYL